MLRGGLQQIVRTRHPRQHEQAVEARGVGPGDVGVQPVTDDQRACRAGAAYGGIEQRAPARP